MKTKMDYETQYEHIKKITTIIHLVEYANKIRQMNKEYNSFFVNFYDTETCFLYDEGKPEEPVDFATSPEAFDSILDFLTSFIKEGAQKQIEVKRLSLSNYNKTVSEEIATLSDILFSVKHKGLF